MMIDKGYSFANTTSTVTGCNFTRYCGTSPPGIEQGVLVLSQLSSSPLVFYWVPFVGDPPYTGSTFLTGLLMGGGTGGMKHDAQVKEFYIIEFGNSPLAWLVRHQYEFVSGIPSVISSTVIVTYTDYVNILFPQSINMHRGTGAIYLNEVDQALGTANIVRYDRDGSNRTILYTDNQTIRWFAPVTNLFHNPTTTFTSPLHDVFLDNNEGKFYEWDISWVYETTYPTPTTWDQLVLSRGGTFSILRRRDKVLYGDDGGILKWVDRDGSNITSVWDPDDDGHPTQSTLRIDAGYD